MSLNGFTVVFDLDGTLVDSAPDLIGALNFALGHEHLDPVDMEQLRRLVGHGAKALIERSLKMYAVAKDPERVERMLAHFMGFYAENIARHSTPYPHVIPTLKALIAQGATCVVCTNKPTALANALLNSLDMTHYFKAVCGGDYFENRKPHAEHILKTIAEAQGSADQAVMVGDSITDRDAARASGVPVILVDYGYTDIPAQDLEADEVISDFSTILSITKKYCA